MPPPSGWKRSEETLWDSFWRAFVKYLGFQCFLAPCEPVIFLLSLKIDDTLTAAVLSSLLLLNTAWSLKIPQPLSPLFFLNLLLQSRPPTLLFFLSFLPWHWSYSLVLCPTFLFSLYASPSFLCALLPSSARLYQGHGKLSCVSTGWLVSLRHMDLHVCPNTERVVCPVCLT